MKEMLEMNNRKVMIYIYVAYVWSFLCWGIGIRMAMNSEGKLLFNAELIESILNGTMNLGLVLPVIITVLAVYGPLLGALLVKRIYGQSNNQKTEPKVTMKLILSAVGILSFISFVPGLVFLKYFDLDMNITRVILLIIVFFIYQVLTSGMEEFGWRGFLFPEMRKSYNLWDASIKTGFIWGFWHTPVVLYMFWSQNMPIPQMVSSFAGFIAGIVGMSVIHGYFYERSRSVYLSVFIHALGNSLPLIIGLLAKEAYMVAVVSQLLLWVVVIVLSKVKKETFRRSPVEVN